MFFSKGGKSAEATPSPQPPPRLSLEPEAEAALRRGEGGGQKGRPEWRIPSRPVQHSLRQRQQPPHLALPRSQHCPSSRLPRPGVRTQHACPTHWHTHLGHQGLKSPECLHQTGTETEPQRVEGTCPRSAETEGARKAGTPDSQCIIFPPAHPEQVGPCT